MSGNDHSEPDVTDWINSDEAQRDIEMNESLDNNMDLPISPAQNAEQDHSEQAAYIEASPVQATMPRGDEILNRLFGDLVQSWDAEYEELYQHFPCSICQDILAAPYVLSTCSHSSCFACLQDQMLAGSFMCCQCRVPFVKEDITYELLLDRLIVADMNHYMEKDDNHAEKATSWVKRRAIHQRSAEVLGRNHEHVDDHHEEENTVAHRSWSITGIILATVIFGLFYIHRRK